jgi:alpha-beta hydrolase superfamily lysophospholipase
MFDTLHSTLYPFSIAQALGPTWSLVTASLGSAGMGWGVSSIARDAEQMSQIISYLKEKRPGGKVVIMGHSTGCQDCMEYLVGKDAGKRPAVDGIILQAPVSDREALQQELPEAFKHEADSLALKMCRDKQAQDAMPNRLTKPVFGRIAITAQRWLDVSSPGPDHSGADDYFSSDLPIARLKTTFGKLPSTSPLLILYSGSDESVPKSVDKLKLVDTWSGVVKDAGGSVDEVNGGVVAGASHSLSTSPDEVVQDIVRRVVGFVGRIDDGSLIAAAGARM